MTDVHFVVNLQKDTATTEFRRRVRPPGYLLPPLYLTETLRTRAGEFANNGELLVVDNGLYDDVGRIADELGPAAKVVKADLDNARERLRRAARSTELGKRATQRITALADLAGDRARGVTPHGTVAERIALRPTALVGVEDITAALWIRLGIDGVLPRTRRRELARRNAAVARQAVEEAAQLPRGVVHLPVAGMIDYDSAFDAGRIFGDAGLRSAAAGFGAYMADPRSIEEVYVGGRRRPLGRSVPARYVRTALAARGFWDGWKKETGTVPKAFHFLGLGAPIMIGITALAAQPTRRLTYDATSPIQDATQGFVYVSKPAYLKVRTWSAAERLASKEGERWRCPCAFCKAFAREHPFDYIAGRQWWQEFRWREVDAKDLQGRTKLAQAYPLLSQPRSGPLAAKVVKSRIGHNHWALEQVCAELRAAGDLRTHVGDVVDAYVSASQGPQFAAAVGIAHDLALGDLP